MNTKPRTSAPGLTLVELLVVLTVVATLAATAMAVLGRLRTIAAEANDLGRMRNLGVALHGWACEHQGRLPRSSHSAVGHGELGWQREILPHLGMDDTSRGTFAKVKASQFGIDASEHPVRSPALNVYFELDPDYDDYEGAPQSWRDFTRIPSPATTILLISSPGTADHVMAQYFTGKAAAHPAPRPGRDKGCVLWVDGHATLEPEGTVFDATKGIDRFHPDKAG